MRFGKATTQCINCRSDLRLPAKPFFDHSFLKISRQNDCAIQHTIPVFFRFFLRMCSTSLSLYFCIHEKAKMTMRIFYEKDKKYRKIEKSKKQLRKKKTQNMKSLSTGKGKSSSCQNHCISSTLKHILVLSTECSKFSYQNKVL